MNCYTPGCTNTATVDVAFDFIHPKSKDMPEHVNHDVQRYCLDHARRFTNLPTPLVRVRMNLPTPLVRVRIPAQTWDAPFRRFR